MNVASLLPNLAKEDYCFTKTETGMVLSMFEVSYLIFTPLVSLSLRKMGRKNAVVIGYFIEILSTVCFGCLTLIPASEDIICDTHWPFFYSALATRAVQGMADAFITTACYSMITIEFPKNTPTYIGYVEMALGLGMMLGPILGSIFMQVLNSIMYTFFAFGALLSLGLFIVLGGLP